MSSSSVWILPVDLGIVSDHVKLFFLRETFNLYLLLNKQGIVCTKQLVAICHSYLIFRLCFACTVCTTSPRKVNMHSIEINRT